MSDKVAIGRTGPDGDVEVTSKAVEAHPTTTKSWQTVNKRLLPVKGYYFFFLAAIGDLLPFISIYMKQLGLSSGETGIIYGVMPFIAFFIRPLIGAMADRLRRHTLVLMVLTLLTGILYMMLLIVPAKPHYEDAVPVRFNIHCNIIDSFIKDCQEYRDNKNECRLTLSEYANLTAMEDKSYNVSDGLFGYQILNNGSTNAVSDDITCRAKCGFSMPGAYGSKVCFSRDISSYQNRKCVPLWVSSTSNSYLEFNLLNVSDVMMHEIQKDRIATSSLHCRDYDLKWMQYNGKTFYQITCDKESVLHCNALCDRNIANKCSVKKAKDSFGKTFWVFFVIYLIGNIAFAPTFSLIDAIVYDTLGKERHRWGFQRLFGTIGFALFAITSTFIMDTVKTKKEEVDFSWSFYLFGILCLVAAIDAKFLAVTPDISTGKFLRNIGKLFTYFHIVVYLFVAMFFGMLTGSIEGFLFWYLKDLGSTQITLGLCLVLNCVFEVFCLFISGFIIKKIGHIPCLYLACLAYAARFLAYSFLQQPWYVMLVEPIHGITFGIMWSAVSSYASIIAPPGMQATVQGLVGGLHFGFGKGIGSLITGYLFELIGERWTFRVLSISAVVVLIVYCLLNKFVLEYPSVKDARDDTTAEAEETTEDGLSAAQDHLLSSDPSANQEEFQSDAGNEKKVHDL
ncbi:major facilitator superfamily domain-containing protein 6-like [Haliotis asinina]|uniref:major facilitator superfamily domain-containing protein 6-like n=1 Tax=Haliotis asinina TaxID=109174 RepID=UPI00353237F5